MKKWKSETSIINLSIIATAKEYSERYAIFCENSGKPGTKKITHLNTDCMELIFEHLNVFGLIKVAESSKRFYGAVCRVFKRKYLNTNIMIVGKEPDYYRLRSENVGTRVLEPNPEMFILHPIIAFKLLRNFGHMIQNLGINFASFNAKVCTEIENYIAEFCCDSLQRLSLICNKHKPPFDNLQKPLKNVTALKIHMMMSQQVNHIRFINEENFPNVKYIFILSKEGQRDSEPKIQHKNIECFTLKADCVCYIWTEFPFSFDGLKHIIVDGSIHLNDAFCEFIASIEHLQTLKIMSMHFDNYLPQLRKLLELPNVKTNIVEMQIRYEENAVSSDDIVRFLKQSPKLRKLSIHEPNFNGYRVSSLVETVSSKLDDEWKIYNIHPYKNPFRNVFEYTCYVIEKIVD